MVLCVWRRGGGEGEGERKGEKGGRRRRGGMRESKRRARGRWGNGVYVFVRWFVCEEGRRELGCVYNSMRVERRAENKERIRRIKYTILLLKFYGKHNKKL